MGYELLIYDEILPVGYGFGVTPETVVDALSQIPSDEAEITVRINSPGGSAFDGVAIYNLLKSDPRQMHVIVDGLAASAASVIAMAGDRITMAGNAMMMIHDASTFARGTAKDLRHEAELLDKVSDRIAWTYAVRSGRPKDEFRESMLADTWYTAEEAVLAGLADIALDHDSGQKLKASGQMWSVTVPDRFKNRVELRPAA